MRALFRLLPGGSAGNEQLTAVVAAVLVVLLAVEGTTLLGIQQLLTVHAFVGVLLLPVVGLKLASTGWRIARYYLGGEEYVRRGPPNVVLRTLVAPLVVLSTITLFVSGIALLALGETSGALVALHKASFVVWLGATGVHVLAHVAKLPRMLRARVPGALLRVSAVAGAVVVGLCLATVTLPAADHLQDAATARVGLDAH
ncbi:MAG TPA: hypothetical protein VFM67_02215 [Gaiella sp.]|jgi:hypothetical protein|nr:hypothetical protein [Gaiella sp.]